MSLEDRHRWEHRHRTAAHLNARDSVRALPAPARSGSLALDVACGQGRHARWLASIGYDVVALDVAYAGLAHARASLGEKDAHAVLAVQGDTDAWPLRPGVFDLVVQVDYLERRIFDDLGAALRPRGLLLIDTFLDHRRPNAEGPSRSEFLLRPSELPHAFRDFDVIRYDEQGGATARAVLLARKR
jgi:SAM-dependent methyltransferase